MDEKLKLMVDQLREKHPDKSEEALMKLAQIKVKRAELLEGKNV